MLFRSKVKGVVITDNKNKLNDDIIVKFIDKLNIRQNLHLFYDISNLDEFIDQDMKETHQNNSDINKLFELYFEFSKIIIDKCIDINNNDNDIDNTIKLNETKYDLLRKYLYCNLL